MYANNVTITIDGSSEAVAEFFRGISNSGKPALEHYGFTACTPIVGSTICDQVAEIHEPAALTSEVTAPSVAEEARVSRKRRTKAEIAAEAAAAAPKAPLASVEHSTPEAPDAPIAEVAPTPEKAPLTGSAPWNTSTTISRELLHKALSDYGVRMIQTGKTQEEADAALMFLISTYGNGAQHLGEVSTECYKELYDAAISNKTA